MSQLGLSVGLSCVFAVLIVVVLFGDVSPGEHGGTEVIHQEAGSAEMPAEPRLAEQMLAQDPLNAVVPEDAAWSDSRVPEVVTSLMSDPKRACPPLTRRVRVKHTKQKLTACGRWYQEKDLDSKLKVMLRHQVGFVENKISLARRGRAELRKIARQLRKHPYIDTEVIGLTPMQGRAGLELSVGRANTTAIFLRSHGCLNKFITHGETGTTAIGVDIRATGSTTRSSKPAGCDRSKVEQDESVDSFACVEDGEAVRRLHESAGERKGKAFLTEQAGGLASTGMFKGKIGRILEVMPEHIHDRCPIIMGGARDVEAVLKRYA
jgi:outer membrane protein OmpA-like peptidoglycan-associated protein